MSIQYNEIALGEDANHVETRVKVKSWCKKLTFNAGTRVYAIDSW